MDFSVFQEIICKIDGVINAKVVYENDNINEIHIIANKIRSPKQIVRDIESSLIASFDYRIDRKVISIAQIEADDYKPIGRIKFSGITIRTSDNHFECTVNLLSEDEEYSISQSGIRTSAKIRKSVAEATIKGIENILKQAYLFDIQDVVITNSIDVSFATVIVNMITDERQEIMIGSALIKNDENEAVARATLDAVNRRMEKAKF